MGSKNKKTTQTTTTRLSPTSQGWREEGVNGLLSTLNSYNTRSPYQAYTGNMVAGMGAGETQARRIAADNVGSQNGLLGEAEDAVRGSMGYDAADPSRFFNPYEDQVVQGVLGDIERSRGMQRVGDAQSATSAGAFGGSRHGVADSLTNEAALREAGSTAASLRRSGYDTAVDTGFRQQQAQREGAQGLAGLAGQRQAQWQQDASFMAGLGATEREIEQARLLADRAEFDREAADRYQRFLLELQTRQGILSSTPMLTDSSSVGYGPASGGGGQGALGGAVSGAAAGSAFGPYGAVIGGVLGGVGGAMSG